MTLYELALDLLRFLRTERTATTLATTDQARLSDVLAAVNGAIQWLWDLSAANAPANAGNACFIQKPMSSMIIAGTNAVSVSNAQAVYYPVVDTTEPNNPIALTPATSKNDILLFSKLHATIAPKPAAGFTASERPSIVFIVSEVTTIPASTPSFALLVAPTPTTDRSLTYNFIPRLIPYKVADLTNTTSGGVVLPIANQHVETLLLPLARQKLSTSVYFMEGAKKDVAAEATRVFQKVAIQEQPTPANQGNRNPSNKPLPPD
ncbi:MAG: hypothetical protein LBT00_13300 [Spirochaetaceae bacterium]|jgi:hypothetical protein|nr:hypothetical protein [Spirochaetaceae bacterium]